MFTESDLREYCSDLLKLENKMKAVYKDLSARLSHAEHSKLFAQLAKEEQQHASQVNRLLEILVGGTKPDRSA
ncbi:MAG: ferritin family protein [Kiritimatiellia bacterium]